MLLLQEFASMYCKHVDCFEAHIEYLTCPDTCMLPHLIRLYYHYNCSQSCRIAVYTQHWKWLKSNLTISLARVVPDSLSSLHQHCFQGSRRYTTCPIQPSTVRWLTGLTMSRNHSSFTVFLFYGFLTLCVQFSFLGKVFYFLLYRKCWKQIFKITI